MSIDQIDPNLLFPSGDIGRAESQAEFNALVISTINQIIEEGFGTVRIGVQPSVTVENWIHTAVPTSTTQLYLLEDDLLHTAFEALCLVADQRATFDTSAGAASSRGIEAIVTSTRTAGANALVNMAIVANASGGDQNFSFFSSTGTFRNDGAALLGAVTATSMLIDTTLTATGASTLGDLRGTEISPASITGTTDNWNPTGLSTATAIRVTTGGATRINGIQGVQPGRILVLHNIDAANTITLGHLDGGSIGAYQINCGGADKAVGPDKSAVLMYDGATTNRWRLLSITP